MSDLNIKSEFVIVGGGVAAARAAFYLRKEGFEGDLYLVTEESQYPYQRPPLSKGYLRGEEGLDEVVEKSENWYIENNITVLTGVKATELNANKHELSLSDGRTLTYTKLLLATGSRASSLGLEGDSLEDVKYLRTLDDSNALAAELRAGGKRLVIIGSGWIGTEVAASATAMGNDVTMVARGSVPFENILGPMIGREVKEMHESHGVAFRMGSKVDRIVGTVRVEGVLVDGATIPADLVLIATGATLNTELAESAGLEVDDGVLVNANMQTSDPDIYAAGDIANIAHAAVGTRVRSEHWAVARATGKAAAKSMMGQFVKYDEIPYFFTDQFDFNMELSGYPHLMSEAEMIISGYLDEHKYVAFWVSGGRVVAGMNVNIWGVNEKVQKLIKSEEQVTAKKLDDLVTKFIYKQKLEDGD